MAEKQWKERGWNAKSSISLDEVGFVVVVVIVVVGVVFVVVFVVFLVIVALKKRGREKFALLSFFIFLHYYL